MPEQATEKYDVNWERIAGSWHSNTERLRVPGGWIIKKSESTVVHNNHSLEHTSMCFYPDPDHQWSPTS